MIHAVKIQGYRIQWDKIREIFSLILFCAILIAAAFGWGMIYENRRSENALKIAQQNERKITEMAGMIEEIRGEKKPEGSRQKAVGRKQ